MADITSLIARGPAKLDFSSIMNLPDAFAKGQAIGADYRARQALSGGLPRAADGSIDFAAAADMLARAGDKEGAIRTATVSSLSGDRAFNRDIKTQELALRRKALEQKTQTLTLEQQVAQRRAAAASLGLDPSNPAYNSYVLTGKMPREDQAPLTATDKKAILEADEAVLQNQAAIKALTEAAKLSPMANSGYFASSRATIGNNLPDYLVPDRISSPESSAATANYENLVLGQALQQLKSIFGAAPTEGERKILLDLQASVGKPDHVRQEILARAKGLAEARLAFNQQRANELRAGTFYKSQGGAKPAQATGDPLSMARDAIARGAPRDAVIQRLRQNGIDPSGL
jgi:hypothetical protein